MIKGILSPDEVRAMYTHWPVLDQRKLDSFKGRKSTRARLFNRRTGAVDIGEVLQCDPIVTAGLQSLRGVIVLNGKHRGVEAGKRDLGLVHYHIERFSDLKHCLPKRLYANLECAMLLYQPSTELPTPERAIAELYEGRQEHYQRCVRAGVATIADLMRNS